MANYDNLELLNTLVDGTLSITHYPFQWEISSYGDKSLFRTGGPIGHICSATLEECVEKALAATAPMIVL